MIDADSKTGFWRFPISLKLVVIWLGLAGLFNFFQVLRFLQLDRFVSSFWENSGFLFYGTVNWSLAIGIANKRDTARLLAIAGIVGWTLASIAFSGVVALASMYPYTLDGPNIDFLPVLPGYALALIVLSSVVNIGVIIVLLKPSTKAIFLSQAPQPETT